MEKYLKDRKGRRLSLSEINHYIKVAKAIDMTVALQENINKIYEKIWNEMSEMGSPINLV